MALFVEPLPGDQFIVEGGRPIQGALRPAGNKNEALPVIAASLLVSGPIVLDNLPQIGDVETLLETVRGLGADILGAALCARGTSHIRNARQIDHGYERIDERLRELGACITRG
jgi:UDP-N-acetylglucosamine enolpyruvyl transferase